MNRLELKRAVGSRYLAQSHVTHSPDFVLVKRSRSLPNAPVCLRDGVLTCIEGWLFFRHYFHFVQYNLHDDLFAICALYHEFTPVDISTYFEDWSEIYFFQKHGSQLFLLQETSPHTVCVLESIAAVNALAADY